MQCNRVNLLTKFHSIQGRNNSRCTPISPSSEEPCVATDFLSAQSPSNVGDAMPECLSLKVKTKE